MRLFGGQFLPPPRGRLAGAEVLHAVGDDRHPELHEGERRLPGARDAYYRHDDLFRAFRYTQAAVEDALFSNVQFRTVQMSELYSIIIASHQAKESRTKHKLQYYLVLISVLSAVLVLLFVYLYKQLRRVYRIKEELSQTNAKLARLNEELGEKNEQLSDSNAVKVQYIARFFDL